MSKKTGWIIAGLAAGVAWIGISRQRRAQNANRWQTHLLKAGRLKAAVTGASSGIGEAYARSLAAQGYDLVLIARRAERLRQQAADYESQYGVQVEVFPADLSIDADIARLEQRIVAGQDIDFLVNNAGYDVFGPFAEIPIEKTLGLINCLELAAVRLTRAALPHMLLCRRGAVINVSSIGAFGPKPFDSTYVAAKAYLNQFSESLTTELRDTGVRVQVLCPGFTLTEFHDAPEYAAYKIKERIPRWLWMTPEQVVRASLTALGQDQPVCVPGWQNRLVALGGRLGLTQVGLKLMRRFFPKQVRYHARPASDPFDLLACPECHGDLEQTGNLDQGSLCCPCCARKYPVVDGIPRFAAYETLDGLDRRFAGLYDWFSLVYRLFSKVAFAYIGTTEDEARFQILDKLAPQGKVLEVSVGPGVNLPYLREYPQVSEIYGLDLSNGQLARCRGYAQAQNWPVHLYQGNAECLPFRDGVFDSVFHIGGINFFNDKHKAIDEMIRVAKPGAKIVICDESERGARGYEITLPGFKQSFHNQRDPVKPPVDLIPAEMEDIRLDENVWKGWFYSVEFRKPDR